MNVDDYAARCLQQLEPPDSQENSAERSAVWLDMLCACRAVVSDLLGSDALLNTHEELLAIYLNRPGAGDFAEMERRFVEAIRTRREIWALICECYFDAEDEMVQVAAAQRLNALIEQYPDQLDAFFIHLPPGYQENTLPEYIRYCEVFNFTPSG